MKPPKKEKENDKPRKKLPVWRIETDLMERLTKAQNRNTNTDIMTFAGFMDTREELEAYVIQKESA